MEFKNKLKEIRNRKGISQQQLADELNISRSVFFMVFSPTLFVIK